MRRLIEREGAAKTRRSHEEHEAHDRHDGMTGRQNINAATARTVIGWITRTRQADDSSR
jgi:hypothetical protein